MPLPLILGIGAGIAALAGAASAVSGGVKMKEANDDLKAINERNSNNVNEFKKQNEVTTKSMDLLGETEMTILSSFEAFSDAFEKIKNKPVFESFTLSEVTLPKYNGEEIKKVSVGAGVLLGGISGAGLGTAGGFAAAGATTAAVMALGTASTGTAIGSLSGIAATNATLAALGGGAIAAGGGGIALGSTILGATTLGIGLLVGGIIFSISGKAISNKVDEARHQVNKNEKLINEICDYLKKLNKTAVNFMTDLKNAYGIYTQHLNELVRIENILHKTDWNEFTDSEKQITENTVLLVSLLYSMCKVPLVIQGEDGEANEVNSAEIMKVRHMSKKVIEEKGFSAPIAF